MIQELFNWTIKKIISKEDSKYNNTLCDLLITIFTCLFIINRKDEFTIECPNVGEISKILIAHNNKGSQPGWFLDRILIEDLSEHRIYEFPCNKWLATDEDDRQISRFLLPRKPGDFGPVATGGK